MLRVPSEIPEPILTTRLYRELLREIVGRGDSFTSARDAFCARLAELETEGMAIDPSEGLPAAWEKHIGRLGITYCCVGYRRPVRLRARAMNDVGV